MTSTTTPLRRGLARILLATLMAVPWTLLGSPADRASAAPVLPSGFQLRDMPTGQSELLTDFAWTPDGGYFTTGKNGRLAWVSASGAARTVATLPVETVGDLGLVGVTVAPDYANSRRVYISRTTAETGERRLRVESWTVTGSTEPAGLTDRQAIIDLPGRAPQHGVGTVVAPDDGTLWIAIGDNVTHTTVDPVALRALDVDQGYGKLLHMYPDGRGVADNPFYEAADPSSWRSRVYAYGFRSPFRFSLDPTTGGPVLGDVGWNTTEEIDAVRPGSNYGWPCWEGPGRTPGYSDLDGCVGVGTAQPLAFYNRGSMGSSVTGGVVYTGSSYPEAYRGSYFFGDYVSRRLYTLRYDANGRLTRPPETGGFGTDMGGPVKFDTAVNGDIVYADIVSSQLRRLVYAPGNRAPVAEATTTTDADTRTVTFDASRSHDLDGDSLTYAWDFGDGATGTGRQAVHQYAAPGTSPVTATLTVTDPLGATGTTAFTVVPANEAPVLALTRPPDGTTYRVGDEVVLSATATDAEDGALTVRWTTTLVHCNDDYCHDHVGRSTDGPSYTETFEDHGDDTRWVVTASATDGTGVVTSAEYTALPRLRTLTITGNVPAAVTVNGVARQTKEVTVGATVSVIAPTTASDGVATFSRWADGAPRARELVMTDSDVDLSVVYETPIDRRYASDTAFRTLLGAPTGPENGDARLRYRDFAGGRAYWAPESGVHEVHGAIRNNYQNGGAHPKFGEPVTDESRTPDGSGRYNHFRANASSYWTPSTGAHLVYGAIRQRWSALGWELGPNGYPLNDESTTRNGLGRYNNFQDGAIYWKPDTGARSVHGSIFDKYASLGWDSSFLGFPTTSETGTPDGVGRFNHFEAGGSIYWSLPTGAHEVHGSIRTRWSQLGWERSYLGYPVSDEFAVAGGRRSDFQNGYIVWTPAGGARDFRY